MPPCGNGVGLRWKQQQKQKQHQEQQQQQQQQQQTAATTTRELMPPCGNGVNIAECPVCYTGERIDFGQFLLIVPSVGQLWMYVPSVTGLEND